MSSQADRLTGSSPPHRTAVLRERISKIATTIFTGVRIVDHHSNPSGRLRTRRFGSTGCFPEVAVFLRRKTADYRKPRRQPNLNRPLAKPEAKSTRFASPRRWPASFTTRGRATIGDQDASGQDSFRRSLPHARACRSRTTTSPSSSRNATQCVFRPRAPRTIEGLPPTSARIDRQEAETQDPLDSPTSRFALPTFDPATRVPRPIDDRANPETLWIDQDERFRNQAEFGQTTRHP